MTENTEAPAPAVAKPAGVRVAGGLMVASYVAGGVGVFLGFGADTPAKGLGWVTLLSVGVLGVLSFVRHSLFHRGDAARMGWELDRRNNFQIEVGLANLAWGLAALATMVWDWGIAARAVVCLVFALYMAQVVVLNLVLLAESPSKARSPAFWARLAAGAALAGFIAWFAVSALLGADGAP